ncbi:sex hormone-binding globulin [Aplysia californica]|uniref:Sex hormone-binding globulin n=1 Tax=Aplysia californica TaxID=6500 RepID=A0ABM1AFC0_APLCA|nr:sex hormone-binding globulin [Aplysia californica]
MDMNAVKRQILYLFYVLLVGDVSFGAIRHLRKICKNSEIEILSNQGVRIEPVTKSHVELVLVDPSLLSTRSKFQLDFEFRTTAPNGVLFYGRPHGHNGQSIALILQNGDLMYKIKCPTLHADIFVPTRNMTQLNDGKWHSISYSVKFKRHGRKGFINIDGFPTPKRYEVSCDHMASLIMGGTSPKDRGYIHELENLPGHFEGCIRNVRIPTALLSPPKYYAVSVCD